MVARRHYKITTTFDEAVYKMTTLVCFGLIYNVLCLFGGFAIATYIVGYILYI